MKKLVTGFLLTVAMLCLSCGDIVIGDSPIVVVGDVCYVFATDEDEVSLSCFSSTWGDEVWVDVYRKIEEGVVVHFEGEFEDISLSVISIDARLYTIPFLSCGDDERCHISSSFNWNWGGVREVTDDEKT